MSAYQAIGATAIVLLVGVLGIMRFWLRGHAKQKEDFESSRVSSSF